MGLPSLKQIRNGMELLRRIESLERRLTELEGQTGGSNSSADKDTIKCHAVNVTLSALHWDSKSYIINNEYIKESSLLAITLGEGATSAQADAYHNAYIDCDKSQDGKAVLKANNQVPQIDVPIRVLVW